MTEDYYDANAIRVPRIWIALVGFFGAEQDVVATKLAGLTGLPNHDVARLMSHEAGASPAKIFLDLGPEHFLDLARRCLDRALSEEPPGIISLPHDMLKDPADRATVLRRAALVHLHQDFEPMVRKVRALVEERPGVFFPWISPETLRAEDLERMLAEAQSGYDEAMFHVDVTGRTTVQVARELIDHFDLWREE